MNDLAKRISALTQEQRKALEKRLKLDGLEKLKNQLHLAIPVADKKEYYSVSFSQMRMYLLEQFEGAQASYNLMETMTIEGELDIDKFKNVLTKLIKRHEMLRTSFHLIEGQVVQRIHEDVNIDLRIIDIEEKIKFLNKADLENRINKAVKEVNQQFDLKSPPLFKVSLIRISLDKHILAYNIHHIISDGVSMGILGTELIKLYNSNELPKLKLEYKDFAEWQKNMLNQDFIKKQEEYWSDIFSKQAQILELPIDYSRSNMMNFKGESLEFEIDKQLTYKLRQLSIFENTTMFNLLLAAYNVVLSTITSSEDVIVGIPSSGRNHSGLESIIGMFVNTLPLRSHPIGSKSFEVYLQEVKENLNAAIDNQDFQFEMILKKFNIKKERNRNPLFDTIFNFQNENFRDGSLSNIKGLKFSQYKIKNDTTTSDITIYATDCKDKIKFLGSYRKGLFRDKTIRYIMKEYVRLLEQIVDDPTKELKSYDIFNIDNVISVNRNSVLMNANYEKFNRKNVYSSIGKCFEEQVDKYSERIAIKYGELKMSYKTLNIKSNRVANAIIKVNSDSKKPMLLLFGHNYNMIIGMIGALKSGITYIPLDSTYPLNRVLFMAQDSEANVILCDDNNFMLAQQIKNNLQSKIEIINIDRIDKDVSNDNPNLKIDHEQIAYILYTSGTTGNPKGVMQSNKNILGFMSTYINSLHISSSDKIALFTSYSHAVGIIDILSTLLTGGTIYPYDIKNQENIKEIVTWINDEKITIFHSIPTFYRCVIDLMTGTNKFEHLRLLILGGETVNKSDLEKYKKYFSNRCVFVNFLGASEVMVATFNFIDKSLESLGASVPVGYAVDDVEVLLINDKGKKVKVYEVGELVYKSIYLSPGYWKLKDKTDQVFVKNPLTNEGIVYKSGDFGRILADGSIEYLGRKDSQVKLRGYRVELSEVEAAIDELKYISKSIVALVEANNNNKFIVAYLIPIDGTDVSIDVIKSSLNEKLPSYMIPARYIKLDKLPLTPNGKIDRKKVLETQVVMELDKEISIPINDTEKSLIRIWRNVLDIEQIGVNDSFFDLGGNSLNVIKLEVELEKEHIYVKTSDIYKYSTIRQLSKFIDGKKQEVDIDFSKTKIRSIDKDVKEGANILTNIKPFNEIFYQSCFYNSAFPIMNHFNKNIIPFLINDICIYKFDEGFNKKDFGSKYIKCDSIENIMNLQGIKFNKNKNVHNIIKTITSALDKHRPVIVWVDCFYLPIRSDMYKKIHWAHSLLVYGYDNNSQTFNIIEHKHKDNLSYEECTVKYSELIEAYKGCLENLKDFEEKGELYEFYINQEIKIEENEDYNKILFKNFTEKREDILEGIKKLNEFTDYFAKILKENSLSNNTEWIINGVNEIINSKNVDKYKFVQMFGEGFEGVQELQMILEEWKFIRIVIAKFMYSNIYNKEKLKLALDSLHKIYHLENEYYANLFKNLV